MHGLPCSDLKCRNLFVLFYTYLYKHFMFALSIIEYLTAQVMQILFALAKYF